MNKSIFIALVSLLFWEVQGQELYNNKSMVVSKGDLATNSYQKDSTANALFIYEKGYKYLDKKNFNFKMEYDAKIKILNEQGYDQGTFEYFLYRQDGRTVEKLKDIKAFTYNLVDDKIVRTAVEEDQIFEERITDKRIKITFTFPNIKPGSVITYSYKLDSPFGPSGFKEWRFQDEIPKLYSEYIADIPGNYLFNTKKVGAFKFTKNESTITERCLESGTASADCAHNIYVVENIPAFIEEDYMTAEENYLYRIDSELTEIKNFNGEVKKYAKSWKTVERELRDDKDVGVQLKKLNLVKDLLPTNVISQPNRLEKAKAIYRFVADNYSFNDEYYVRRETNIKNLIENKSGNVSEINILLHNLLKQRGYDVQPVFASTRNNGFITKLYPVLNDFNYLFVQLKLEGKTYFLDATVNTLPFGELPFRCLNHYARVMDFKNESSWVDIKPNMTSQKYHSDEISFNEDHTLSGKATLAYSGYPGYFKRNRIDNDTKGYIEKAKQNNNDIDIIDHQIKNLEEYNKHIVEEISYNTESIEDIEGTFYVNPFKFIFFEKNPFKLNQRTYPIDFGYKPNYIYRVKLTIPEGYIFEENPEKASIQLPQNLGSIQIFCQQKEQTLYINYRANLTSHYYPADFYDALKAFWGKMVEIENNSVVLIKKKES